MAFSFIAQAATDAATIIGNLKILPPPGVSQRFTDLGKLISDGIGAAIVISAVLALIYIVWGGISWITSGGDKTALEGARARITNAIVGLIVVVASYAIFVLVTQFIGLDSLTFNTSSDQSSSVTTVDIATIATGLDTPWGLTFLPDDSMLVTERPGRVRLVDVTGTLDPQPIATIMSVKEIGEGGLLGIALHPQFTTNHFVYLYYTYENNNDKTLNRVVRMTFTDKKLTDEQIIVDAIPGASNHNGGRIKFGPDKFLYITTGDAQEPSQAQDTNSLAGKILRVTDTGAIPKDNPFNNAVYSYGHRNPQGITWDDRGRLWATEHGRSGIQSGLDELNVIEKGNNYGWPAIAGDESKPGMQKPKLHSGSSTTWAPAGAAFFNGSIFFGGLRGQTLYQADVTKDTIVLREHLKEQFGRIRDVVLGPNNFLYITTSNQDGRGSPQSDDDRIIKINQIRG